MTHAAHDPNAPVAVGERYRCPFCRKVIHTALFYDLHLATFHVDPAPVDPPHVQAFSDLVRVGQQREEAQS